MDIGILHLHVTVVTLFLIFFLFKTVLLVFNAKSFLQKVRTKTKIADMVLGALILITGIYLAVIKGSVPTYLMLKIILVFLAIPLGIIGINRSSKLLAIISLLVFIYVYGIAETRSYNFKKEALVLEELQSPTDEIVAENINQSLRNGKLIYQKICVECHGKDGKKGLYKSPDLTKSKLSAEEMAGIIKNGKGMMRAYEDILSDEEIAMVVGYVATLPTEGNE